MGKINIYNKIIIENQIKEKIRKSKKFLHNGPYNRWFMNGINVQNRSLYAS